MGWSPDPGEVLSGELPPVLPAVLGSSPKPGEAWGNPAGLGELMGDWKEGGMPAPMPIPRPVPIPGWENPEVGESADGARETERERGRERFKNHILHLYLVLPFSAMEMDMFVSRVYTHIHVHSSLLN